MRRSLIIASLLPLVACSSLKSKLGGSSTSPTSPTSPSGGSVSGPSAGDNSSVAGPSDAAPSGSQNLAYEFSQEIQPLKGAIQSLDSHVGREPAKHRLIMEKDLAKYIAEGESLGGLATHCQGKYKALPPRKTGEPEDPENACNLAINWKSLFQKHLDFTAASFASSSSKGVQGTLDKLEKTGVIYPNDEKEFTSPAGAAGGEKWKMIVDAYAKIGAKPPADPTGGTSDVAKTYPAVLKKAASVARWPAEATNKDKEVEAAMKKTLEGAGYKVLKTGLVTPAWEIDKNELGVPVHRKRLGVIMVQAKGETFCRNYVVIPGGDHEGGGKFTATMVRFDPLQLESTITKCN